VNKVRPERISEQAAGVVDRTLDLIRRMAAATRIAKRESGFGFAMNTSDRSG